MTEHHLTILKIKCAAAFALLLVIALLRSFYVDAT
jgi:hypothetical protein